MDHGLLLTLRLNGTAEKSLDEKLEVDDLIQALEADLQEFDSVRISSPLGEDVEPGLKMGVGPLLGLLTAEVHGEMVAIKVLRHLFSTVTDQRHPFELEVQHKRQDGSETSIKLKGPVRDAEAITALLNQVQTFLSKSN